MNAALRPDVPARLQVTDSLGSRTLPLDRDLFTIGRRSTHDLHLSGADVSRDHAQIERHADRFTIRDTGSRCGTFVNGEPITERTLQNGDRIHIGRTMGADLVFTLEQAEPQTAVSAAGDLRQVATLLEALRAPGSRRVLDEVLALVLDSALDVTAADRGFIMLADAGGHLEFTLGRARGRVTLPGRTFHTSRKIPEEVFSTGESRVVADLLDTELANGHEGTIAFGIRHVLCVPLKLVRYEDRPADEEPAQSIGVLYLDGKNRGTLLSATTRAALEALAWEAAVAIENARLYRAAVEKARLDEQMAMAAEIQRALLPPAQHSGPDFELSCASIPCLTIGGDFFDYLDLPAGAFGFVVGDVSGKGVPAALLTAMLQGIFATEAALGHPPAESLGRLNLALLRKEVLGRFATLFYAVLGNDGRLTYSNAGHNPPLLVRGSEIRRLDRGGTIIGVFEDARYEQDVVPLEPHDLVVVFSDGVTEAFNAEGEEFGDDRLIDCVRANRELPPAAIVERLTASIKSFVKDAAPSDDITILVLRYR